MRAKDNSSRDWKREERPGVLSRNSTLNVEEYERDGVERHGNKRSVYN